MDSVNGKLLGKNGILVNSTPQDNQNTHQETNKIQSMLAEINQVSQQLFLRFKKVEKPGQGESHRETLLNQVEASLQQIEQRCDHLETQLKTNTTQSHLTYQQQIQEINTSLDTIKNYLTCIERQIPKKMLWLIVSSSLAIAFLSLYNWLNIRHLNQEFNSQLINQVLTKPSLESTTNNHQV